MLCSNKMLKLCVCVLPSQVASNKIFDYHFIVFLMSTIHYKSLNKHFQQSDKVTATH